MSPCSKKGYPSRKQAKTALRIIRSKCLAQGRKAPVREYKCEKCGKWHLTSMAEPPAWVSRYRKRAGQLNRSVSATTMPSGPRTWAITQVSL